MQEIQHQNTDSYKLFSKEILLNINNSFLFVFLFLFLYANVLSRATGLYFNELFYLAWSLILFISLMSKGYLFGLIVVVVVSISMLFVVLVSSSYMSVLYASKDIFLPMLSIFIGWTYGREIFLSYLNKLYLPFVWYGMAQAIFSRAGVLSDFMPWDAENISNLVDAGVTNLYQDELLRVFGTMNSFWEYQLLIVMIPIFLWENLRYSKKRKLLGINIVSGFLLLVLMVERMPIFFVSLYFVIQGFVGMKGIRVMFSRLLLIALFFVIVVSVGITVSDSESAVDRLIYPIFNIGQDHSLMNRVLIWNHALELISQNLFFGYENLDILPSAESLSSNHFSPHNGYLFMYLIFGVVVGSMMLALYVVMAVHCFLNHSNKFVFVLILIYLTLAVMHVPFIGRLCCFLFILVGVMDRVSSRASIGRNHAAL